MGLEDRSFGRPLWGPSIASASQVRLSSGSGGTGIRDRGDDDGRDDTRYCECGDPEDVHEGAAYKKPGPCRECPCKKFQSAS
jgi:hypothetical protein